MIILMILCWLIAAFCTAGMVDYLIGDSIDGIFKVVIIGICVVFCKYLFIPLLFVSIIKYIINS